MPLVFSAIVPHSPVLIPEIGKQNTVLLKKTLKSLETLRNNLENSKPDSIIIISSHGVYFEDAFAINLSPLYTGNLEKFGDFSDTQSFPGDIALIHKIREFLETKSKLTLVSNNKIDYGIFVPLNLLAKNLSQTKIVPLHYSGLSYKEHFEFGNLLRQKILETNKNIAVIASGDLSHKLSKKSSVQYSPEGKKFDKRLIDILLGQKQSELTKINKKLADKTGQCALKSILILLGVLNKTKNTPTLLSYEHPLGVGFLTMEFKF